MKLATLSEQQWDRWNKLGKMKSEKIIKIGRLVYAKLFDDNGNVELNDYVSFKDKNGEYTCTRKFWRFYIIS